MGSFLHACEGELVCESINTKIPYFNAPIYLQNKVNPNSAHLQKFTPTNSITDSNWKSGRDSRSHKPGLLHHQAASSPSSNFFSEPILTFSRTEGIQATSFKSGDKFYIGGDKLLPLEKFLPKPKPPPGAAKPKRAGGARGGGRGAPMRGGRGGSRGAPRGRGGFSAGGRGGGRGGSGGFSRGGAGGRGGSRGGFTRGRG